MASTPSASALSAVLRCRPNIWSGGSARLSGSAARELPVSTVSLWDAFTRGERRVLGLAVSCTAPWKRKKSPTASLARAQTRGHAHEPTPMCTRPSLCAPHLKVAFVYETHGATRSVCVRVRGACGSWSSLSSFSWLSSLSSLGRDLLLGRVLLLVRTDLDQEDEDRGHSKDPQTLGAGAAGGAGGAGAAGGAAGAAGAVLVDSCPGEGSVGRVQVMEDRPD